MTYHPAVEKIKSLLESHHIKYETFEHVSVRTSEEAAKVRPGYTLEQGAKALIIKANGKFWMFVMPAHLRLNNSKVRKALNQKDFRFATPGEVSQLTQGVQVGGVPPFGNLFNIPVIVDPQLFANKRIVFNAGDRSYSIAIDSADYKSLFPFEEVSVTQ